MKIIYWIGWYFNLIKLDVYKDEKQQFEYIKNPEIDERHVEDLWKEYNFFENNYALLEKVVHVWLKNWFYPKEFLDWLRSVNWDKIHDWLMENGTEEYKIKNLLWELSVKTFLDYFKRKEND